MKDIKEWLAQYPKQRITLSDLEKKCTTLKSYKFFSDYIIVLTKEQVLTPVKSSGTNGKSVPLHNKYTINKSLLKREQTEIINNKILRTSSLLSLEVYFELPLSVYKADLPSIDSIDAYLKEYGLPVDKFLPELAFELTGDEKWIEKGPGKLILKRLGLWEKLKVKRQSDPIAFGINKNHINDEVQKHLIIENKTAYLHALNNIHLSEFSTVIYGQGWKIVGGLQLFSSQFPFGKKHEFYYFGDLDKSGIAIYTSLKDRYAIQLSTDFYRMMFEKKQYKGKETQECSNTTIEQFVKALKKDDEDKRPDYILEMLKLGNYQPQEILSEEEMKKVLSNVRS